ncbi:MAG: GGDEF domain-containing protein [Planctomycetes bacterium]|nr:GGDEF domain-containing protein [Planctomycetota bacterium]
MEPEGSFYRDLLDSLAEGVYIVDHDGKITFWNRAAERITGYGAETVLGRKCSDGLLCHMDDAGRVLCLDGCPLMATRADGAEREARVYLRHAGGHRVPVLVRAAPVRDPRGRIIGAAESFSDDSARIESLRRVAELEALAYLDPLTGLGNRRYAEDVIAARLREMERTGVTFGILFADLDHFKELNDRLGHAAGDEALRMTGRTLSACLRAYDFAGRWGGEEFVAVLMRVDGDGLLHIAERFRSLVAASPLRTGGAEASITVSIGITLAHTGDTVEGLVARADAAMYESKAAGRNRVTQRGHPRNPG